MKSFSFFSPFFIVTIVVVLFCPARRFFFGFGFDFSFRLGFGFGLGLGFGFRFAAPGAPVGGGFEISLLLVLLGFDESGGKPRQSLFVSLFGQTVVVGDELQVVVVGYDAGNLSHELQQHLFG